MHSYDRLVQRIKALPEPYQTLMSLRFEMGCTNPTTLAYLVNQRPGAEQINAAAAERMLTHAIDMVRGSMEDA